MIDVILPVLNEAHALAGVLSGLPTGFRAIVVDNGSTDGSGDIARRLGAEVMVEAQRGFGSACSAGLRGSGADVVCFMDCDGSFNGSDLSHVAESVVEGSADLVLGARSAGPGWPLHARVANRVLAWEVRRRTGVRLRDLGPMRAGRRAELLDLDIRDRRFGWPLEMILRAGARRWRIREVPVQYSPRIGRSKVTGTLSGTARTVYDMGRLLR